MERLRGIAKDEKSLLNMELLRLHDDLTAFSEECAFFCDAFVAIVSCCDNFEQDGIGSVRAQRASAEAQGHRAEGAVATHPGDRVADRRTRKVERRVCVWVGQGWLNRRGLVQPLFNAADSRSRRCS